MSTAEENKVIVRRVLGLLDQGDSANRLADHPGLYETRQRHPLVRAAFPDLRTTIEEQIAEGEMVATRATISGAHLGEFMGVAPTGKRLTWGMLLLDHVVDGRIMVHYANADWISVLIQLGVIRPPGQARD